jgi:hypothetical protein
MRISFDLDETLICTDVNVPREPIPAWYRRLLASTEPMRSGTCDLISLLRDSDWEIWVYTTSHRSRFAIRQWMRSYGIKLDGVINQPIHARAMRQHPRRPPSKNPAAFGIDLHVDDLHGVRIEGEQLGFTVVVVQPHDPAWTDVVLHAANIFARAFAKASEVGQLGNARAFSTTD